jgi:hypothetical protein
MTKTARYVILILGCGLLAYQFGAPAGAGILLITLAQIG